MVQAEKIKLILVEEYIKSQARNPSYSMRAFSKKIGISQSAISEILADKRPITKKAAIKILEGLSIDPIKVSSLFESNDSGNVQKFKSLDLDTFYMISEWHYFAILSLAETKDFESSPKWIASRLGISLKTAKEAIERLLRFDLLIEDPNGNLKSTGEQFEAVSELLRPALKKANRQNLELASLALDEIPVENRDFTAMTLCFDPARINDAKKLIKNFRRNFSRVMESGHKKEVYKLCLQLFPLSKEVNRE